MPGSVSERRHRARTAVIWDDLDEVLNGPSLDVVDVGGGTGGPAVRVAGHGHRVTVVDPSPDALAALGRRAREVGVPIASHQGDLLSLPDVVGAASADLVMCHGVLEVVEDPTAGIAAIAEVLRPQGTLSLLVAQRHAAVIARALAGHFAQSLELLSGTDGTGDDRMGHRFTVDEITALVREAGLEVISVHAVRTFADLVPGSLLDLEPGAADALVDLERAVATRPEYRSLAAQLHIVAVK